jgi:hydroxyquinol 1,2-dioxygenase
MLQRHPRKSLDRMSKNYLTEENSAEIVNARMDDNINPRLAEVMGSLVRHLHSFTTDIRLKQDEWEAAIRFLTRTGQASSEERQEFILLSDALGLSMLVDAINNHRPEGATENTVLGPFHIDGAPMREYGDRICLDDKGESCLYSGTVLDLQGKPVSGARIDVWSDNADGFYDVQQPEIQPKWNNRGVFITGADGHYNFVGIKPQSYPIPIDGPVGEMLEKLGRHPSRPAHMHFIISAEGFQKLVTHTFVAGDPHLETDVVFGVKQSLIAPFKPVDNGSTLWSSNFDFVLAPTVNAKAAISEA